MLKKQLIKDVAAESGHTEKTVREVHDATESVVLRCIRLGREVMLLGFGKLVTSRRGPKPARNPRTGESVVVPARTVAWLKPSAGLTAAANKTK